MLPVIAVFAITCLWLFAVASMQVRATDAAREVARMVARGDDVADARAAGRSITSEQARVSVGDGGSTIRVQVEVESPAPWGFLSFLPAPTITASAVAAKEIG